MLNIPFEGGVRRLLPLEAYLEFFPGGKGIVKDDAVSFLLSPWLSASCFVSNIRGDVK